VILIPTSTEAVEAFDRAIGLDEDAPKAGLTFPYWLCRNELFSPVTPIEAA
jgi:hypothetical protein